MKHFALTALLVAVALAACAQTATAPVPDNLKPDATQTLLRTLSGRGVQIYECRAQPGDAAGAAWVFVRPEADLFDGQGKLVGMNIAGPHWESTDGSRVVGSVKAQANAPQAGAIPWLLLSTRSDGKDGVFASTTSVQRLNTVGGVAPAAATCTAATIGQAVRVSYTADYAMYGTR
jgi:hypothetical protein